MMLFMVIVCLAVLLLLVAVQGIMPVAAGVSLFELERRVSQGDTSAKWQLRRERLLGDVLALQRVVSALLLVVFAALSIATFGWLLGIIIATFVALESGAIARVSFWQKKIQKLYDQYETQLLDFIDKISPGLRFVRSAIPESPPPRFTSREELHHMVEESGNLLAPDEKKLILQSLTFEAKKVSTIMTPRGVIDTIGKKELLGPLVLDGLHKTGHSRFPVIDGDIDHVIGVLHIQDLLTIDGRRSTTAEKAMEAKVFYINENQTLKEALAAFIRTRHHLFVVVNEFRETVGVLSLEDVIESLLGRKIVDEFDTHEDLRAVAQRNIRGNNHPEKREDV